MDKFEEFVQKVGMAKVTPEDLSWIVGYTTTLRSRLKSILKDQLEAARDAFESEEPLAVGRFYVTGQRPADRTSAHHVEEKP